MMVTTTNDVLNVVKKTFEKTKNIKFFTLYAEKNNIYGIYCNNIDDILRFSSVPDISFTTDLEGYNIFLFELGNVLYNIYNNASSSLFFVNILLHENYLKIDEDYQEIINFVGNNIPLFLIKGWLIENIDEVIEQETLTTEDTLLMNVMHVAQLFIEYSDIVFDVNFLEDFLGENDTKDLRIKINNCLSEFKQLLLEKHYSKISEGDIAILDQDFINFQFIQMDV